MRLPQIYPAAGGVPPRRRGAALLSSVILLLATVVVLTSACDTRASVSTPRATATPAGLPAFTDWRVVYADGGGRIHAISIDGKQNVAGPLQLELHPSSLGFPSVSPDGRWLAYASVSLLDLAGRHAALSYAGGFHTFAWSADGSMLALYDGHVVHVPDGAIRQIPPITGATFELIGWVDSTHLAGRYAPITPAPTRPPTPTPLSSGGPPPGPQTVTLAVQDITTGAVHTVFSLTSSSLGLGYFTLAPDGQHALFYNTRWRNDPYTPDVRLIDMASGAATKLPHLSQVLGQGFGATSIAWHAGTLTLAASTGVLENGDLKSWLLDVQHDTAQALPYAAYVGGWVPNSDTLVLTTGRVSIGYAGPFTFTAVANVTSGSSIATTLTEEAYHLSFAGFARTAS